MNSYERVMNAVKFKDVDVIPVCPFVLAFAAKTSGVSYYSYCTDYTKLVKAQLDCVEQFGYDIVTADSDAYREAHDCGAVIEYPEDDLPIEKKAAFRNKRDFLNADIPDPLNAERMTDKINAVREFKRKVGGQIPVQGWVEAPFQSASILRGLNDFMIDMYDDEKFVEQLLEFACEMGIRFGKAQVKAGADIIGIGDAVATLVSSDMYRKFALPYAKRLVKQIKDAGAIVKYHICGDSQHFFRELMDLGIDILNIDSKVDLKFAKELSRQNKICIKGNVDPVAILNGHVEEIKGLAKNCIRIGGTGYILSAGCEIPKNTPPINFKAFVDSRHEL
ncbi:MAG: uroporphyrinogen decarboxylase family protein [Clostridia bacterium]|nr:uroporphyrinogen decarboxylase family protein [Clostridia bacterium]